MNLAAGPHEPGGVRLDPEELSFAVGRVLGEAKSLIAAGRSVRRREVLAQRPPGRRVGLIVEVLPEEVAARVDLGQPGHERDAVQQL